MTPGTRSHIDYTNWISRIRILGAELRELQRNTQWMLTNYFEDLPAHRRENYIDAYGRFRDAIRNARLVDLDDENIASCAGWHRNSWWRSWAAVRRFRSRGSF